MVFSITNEEAEKLVLKHMDDKEYYSKLMYNLVDTFKLITGWVRRPDKGHFIFAEVKGNKMYCEYKFIAPFQVFLIKEYNALAIQVIDLDGKVIENAKVFLNYKKIPYDKFTKTYRIENDWIFKVKNMYLKVVVNDFTCFINLNTLEPPYRHINEYVNYGFNSIKFYSYLITDKNKYKPGDRVRFKSYALSRFRVPLKKELELWLSGNGKNVKIKNIEPLRPGCYVGDFYLHDSLKIQLDKFYNLQLKIPENNIIVASTNFKYEDYELSGIKVDISLKNNKHYYPEKNILSLRVTDINGLYVQDAKAEVLIKVLNINKPFENYLFYKDTLMYINRNLDKDKPTQIEIPSEIFKKANLNYRIFVNVLTSNNEKIEKSVDADFYYSNYDMAYELIKDSIRFFLTYNGKEVYNVNGKIFYNNENNLYKEVNLPYIEKINPLISTVYIKTDLIEKEINLGYIKPYIEVKGEIIGDSFKLELENPNLLDTKWYIYQGSDLISKGSGKIIKFSTFIYDKTKSFYIDVSYLYAGNEYVISREFKIQESKLNIKIDIPERVYPGKTIDAEIYVSDFYGEPVRNVDLTAFGVDAKLNYNFPKIPYYGSTSMGRLKKYSYSINKDSKKIILDLDYSRWNKILGLDTMMYYKFAYPDQNYFIYQYPIDDSTQFAPFVMENGKALHIYVIEINNKPIFFSWTNHTKRYSFYVPHSKKVQITMRLSDRLIRLDSIIFPKNTKTIISCNLEHIPAENKIILSDKFTDYEQKKYSFYISSFNFKNIKWAYLLDKNNNIIPLIIYPKKNNERITVGPVEPSYYTYVDNLYSLKYKQECCCNNYIQDNIVYREKQHINLDFKLIKKYFDPFNVINDLAINKKIFEEMITVKPRYVRWFTKIVHLISDRFNFKIFLPNSEKPIVAVLFENEKGKIISSIYSIKFRYFENLQNMKKGFYNLIILYEDGSYVKKNMVYFNCEGLLCLDLRQEKLKDKDVYSDNLLKNYYKTEEEVINYLFSDYEVFSESEIDQKGYIVELDNPLVYNISGTVLDEFGNPLPGVVVNIKDTKFYTITNGSGKFYFNISYIDKPDDIVELEFRLFGYKETVVNALKGTDIVVKMEPEIYNLSEVVIVGYSYSSSPSLTGSYAQIKDDNIIFPEYDKPSEMNEKIVIDFEENLYKELLTLNKIRSNFQDVAFWEPTLLTDKKGKANFSIKFPDNITKWNTVVYGMNEHLQTGMTIKSILSYKPLMTELNIPQYLIVGDSTNLIGKVSNYTNDTLIKGSIEFKKNNIKMFSDSIAFKYDHITKLGIKPNTHDTIVLSYSFKGDDGYFDGEERKLPVLEKGITIVEGGLNFLKSGDSITYENKNAKMFIEIINNKIDIFLNDIKYLNSYEHYCNEQLSSILTSFLTLKIYYDHIEKKFDYNDNIHKIINLLLKNQNNQFFWSWWGNQSNTSYWVSAHVLRSLKFAKDMGYKVDLDLENLKKKLVYKYFILKSIHVYDIEILNAIANWNVEFDYNLLIPELDSLLNVYQQRDYNKSFLYYKFLLEEIKQLRNLNFDINNILKYKNETILGKVFFDDYKHNISHWIEDKLNTNIVAYRIIRRDPVLRNEYCDKLILYMINEKNKYQLNTYYISSILNTVFYDLLNFGMISGKNEYLIIKGKENRIIKEFPYKIQLSENERIEIINKTKMFFYIMDYKNKKVTEPYEYNDKLNIETYFENKNDNYLKSGEPVNFIINVKTLTDCEYVILEIPIPAGCSYYEKTIRTYDFETHREYYKEKTVIYIENLKKGIYDFKISLLPRYTGKYNINPAKISLMYFPVITSNNGMKTVTVY